MSPGRWPRGPASGRSTRPDGHCGGSRPCRRCLAPGRPCSRWLARWANARSSPTSTLAAATAALAAGVGFLPVSGAEAGLGPLVTGAAVSLLAASGALVQPWAGRARDAGRLPDAGGMAVGLVLAAAGLGIAALVPGLTGLLTAARASHAGPSIQRGPGKVTKGSGSRRAPYGWWVRFLRRQSGDGNGTDEQDQRARAA